MNSNSNVNYGGWTPVAVDGPQALKHIMGIVSQHYTGPPLTRTDRNFNLKLSQLVDLTLRTTLASQKLPMLLIVRNPHQIACYIPNYSVVARWWLFKNFKTSIVKFENNFEVEFLSATDVIALFAGRRVSLAGAIIIQPSVLKLGWKSDNTGKIRLALTEPTLAANLTAFSEEQRKTLEGQALKSYPSVFKEMEATEGRVTPSEHFPDTLNSLARHLSNYIGLSENYKTVSISEVWARINETLDSLDPQGNQIETEVEIKTPLAMFELYRYEGGPTI